MYYCKSRFYVPKWRRWLNNDSINYLEPQNITCLNLFAYCNNNPVMYVDENGNFAIVIAAGIAFGMHELLVALGIVAVTATVVTAVKLESEYHYIERGINNIIENVSSGINLLTASLEDELNGHRTTKNGRGRTRNKHEEGLSRKQRDMKFGEKGDRVRIRRKDPKKRKNLWILALLGLNDDDENKLLWFWRCL